MTGNGRARWRERLGAGFMAAALAAVAWSLVILLSGGFVLTAVRVSARDPWRPLGAAALLCVLAFATHRRSAWRTLLQTAGHGPVLPRRAALAAACAIFVAAVSWNAAAAGGSDSSCYVLQAEAFRHAQVVLREPLARELPVAHADAVFAPTGFLASRVEHGAAVPICGPGLAIAMAAASVAGGGRAIMLVVPVFGAWLVWSTFLLGRRLDDEWSGAAAGVLVAASPIVLYQVVQPMSDIPAAALWAAATAAVVRRDVRGAIAGGFLASAAVLVRPNLGLPVPVLAYLLLAHRAPWRERLRLVVAFGAAALPCVLALAWLNARRYGSPFVSGYGNTGDLFALAHVRPNVARYTSWLLATETPLVLLAFAAPVWAWRRRRRDVILTLGILLAIALIVVTYLAYTVFSEWWYVRFLLPALPLLFVLAIAVWLSIAGDRPVARGAVALVTCGVLCAFYVHVARDRQVFDLRSLESRFVLTGRYASRALPDTAVVLAVQEGGAVRYHGRRVSAMWDQLEPTELDGAIAWLTAHGRPVFIALEDAEAPAFRARFATQAFGRLDWPPRAEVHAAVRVLVYAAADRERFRRGVPISPEPVR